MLLVDRSECSHFEEQAVSTLEADPGASLKCSNFSGGKLSRKIRVNLGWDLPEGKNYNNYNMFGVSSYK